MALQGQCAGADRQCVNTRLSAAKCSGRRYLDGRHVHICKTLKVVVSLMSFQRLLDSFQIFRCLLFARVDLGKAAVAESTTLQQCYFICLVIHTNTHTYIYLCLYRYVSPFCFARLPSTKHNQMPISLHYSCK